MIVNMLLCQPVSTVDKNTLVAQYEMLELRTHKHKSIQVYEKIEDSDRSCILYFIYSGQFHGKRRSK